MISLARRTGALAACAAIAAFALPLSARQQPAAALRPVTSVTLGVESIDGGPGAALLESTDAILRVRMKDATTGAPLKGADATGWITPHAADSGTAAGCRLRVEAFLSGGVFAAPEVELNASYVIGLNDDATVTVLSPQRSFGGTRLVALLQLPSRGVDWALTNDGRRLFVSLSTSEVAVIDTAVWRVRTTIPTRAPGARLFLQPDGGYLWIASKAGLDVVDPRTLASAAQWTLPSAPAGLAFSSDSARAYVILPDEKSAVVYTSSPPAEVARVETGGRPSAVAFSSASQSAWVVQEDGPLLQIAGARPSIVTRVELEPGTTAIGFAGDRRYGLLLNPSRSEASVLDTARGRIVQTSRVNGAPDRLVFSDAQAYLVPRTGDLVTLVPLEGIGNPGTPLPAAEVPYNSGSNSPGGFASPITRATGMGAMLFAAGADQAIHVYREGMAAPMATLRNDRRAPRAVLVVERQWRETSAGTYETITRLPSSGRHDVVIYSRAAGAHCFTIDVAGTTPAVTTAGPPAIVPLPSPAPATTGQPYTVRFRLLDKPGGKPLPVRDDVSLMVMLAPGRWSQRKPARAAADGVYEIDVIPPADGIYYAYLECPGLGITYSNPSYGVFEARRAQ